MKVNIDIKNSTQQLTLWHSLCYSGHVFGQPPHQPTTVDWKVATASSSQDIEVFQ
jgi:hypothetical protein